MSVLLGCRAAPQPAPTPSPLAALPRSALKTPLDIAPQDLEAIGGLTESWTKGQPPAALRELVAKSRSSSDLAAMLALLMSQHGAHDTALELSQQALKQAPSDAVALLGAGQVERTLGLTRDAEVHLRAAAKAAPDALETRSALAQILEDGEHYAEAEAEWVETLRRDDKNPALWGKLVACRLRQENFAGARAALDSLRKLVPDSPPTYLQAAEIDRQEARKSPERAAALQDSAAAQLDLCLGASPGFPPAAALRGMIFEERGDDAKALPLLEKAYALAPELPELRPRLAQVLLRSGQKTRGEAFLVTQRARDKTAEERRRLAARVGTNPDDLDGRRLLARWCETAKDPIRARIEWRAILAKQPADSEARAAIQRLPAPAFGR